MGRTRKSFATWRKKSTKFCPTTKRGRALIHDPCSGDSGGPLMWRDQSGRYRVIGTVAGGGFNCDENRQVAHYFGDARQKYTNVAYFVRWLKKLLMDGKERAIKQCSILD